MYNHNLNRKGLRRTDADRPRPLADAVLRLIWQERRISRAEIARRANLSRSTVSEIVSEILPMGLVAEIGEGPSRGGRRPSCWSSVTMPVSSSGSRWARPMSPSPSSTCAGRC